MFMIMMIMMVLFMYFGVIRPQKRQRQAHEQKMAGLRTGDKIITAGGIYGIITNVKQTSVVLRIAENVRIELDKSSVGTILRKADEPEEALEETQKDDESSGDEEEAPTPKPSSKQS
jgi:preprotein translocase subunit YajC